MERQMADVEGYEGFYKVTSDGKVFSPTGIKKTYVEKNGYERVSLWRNGKGKHYSIHRLVALAFIPKQDGCDMVNHKDGNKLNNNVDNLEWCNASHNIKHAYKHKLIKPKTHKVIQFTRDHKKIKEWESISEACESLGLNHANVVTVCKQKTNRKECGGFIWRYSDDI